MQPIVSDEKMSDLVDPRVVTLLLGLALKRHRRLRRGLALAARLRAVGIAVK